ncbi:MAG: 30S ribosomal protein S16 [Bacteriovoracaceae bacterium]|nr:30S ribosomal protein S16 [Bacteriovoracaceae bacterium]
MVKIRMTRLGRKNLPIYSIVATDSRSPRDGQFLEKLGQYNPKSPETLKSINVDGIKAWLGKGAQLSDTVRTLLKKNNIKL